MRPRVLVGNEKSAQAFYALTQVKPPTMSFHLRVEGLIGGGGREVMADAVKLQSGVVRFPNPLATGSSQLGNLSRI